LLAFWDDSLSTKNVGLNAKEKKWIKLDRTVLIKGYKIETKS